MISFPIIAACEAPTPGRRVEKGAAIRAPIPGLIKSFFFNLSCEKKMWILFFMFFSLFLVFLIFKFMISCFGIFCFFSMEVIRAEEPNNPVRRGKIGFLIDKEKTEIPRKPARRKTIRAGIRALSLIIINIDIKISK